MGKLIEGIAQLVEKHRYRGVDDWKVAQRLREAADKLDPAKGRELEIDLGDGTVGFIDTSTIAETLKKQPLLFSILCGFSGLNVTIMHETLAAAAGTFDQYAANHFTKGTGDGLIKAGRNVAMADMCMTAIGKRYYAPNAPDRPEEFGLVRVQGLDEPTDSDESILKKIEANKRPLVRMLGSQLPMDRDEVVNHITKKIALCQSKGMSEAANVLTGLVGEIEQHLEERPLDVEAALRAFYTQVFEGNAPSLTSAAANRNPDDPCRAGESFFSGYGSTASDTLYPQDPSG